MTNQAEESVGQLQPTQQQKPLDINKATDKAEWIEGCGRYQFCKPAQDQIIAYIEGMKISGTFTPNPGDSQSDCTAATPSQLKSEKLLWDTVEEFSNRVCKVWKSFDDEETALSVEVEEQVGGQVADTETDDVLQWAPDQLVSAILHPQAGSDMPHLREMILIAEDTGFSVEESKQLAPWLLNFAQKYRDSNDPQDEVAVWSAIRTGASMLRPQSTNLLFPLLEPGHSIETSLVTVKMVGRIFEAQPPAKIDEYKELANEVCRIAKSLLNLYAITSSQSAAMAQLAIYALAAMASSKTQQIVETVKQLGVIWFTRRTFRKLRELANIWASRPVPVAEKPKELLSETIQMLEHD